MRAKRATKSKAKLVNGTDTIVELLCVLSDNISALNKRMDALLPRPGESVGDPVEQPGTIQTAPPLENMAAKGPKIPHLPWITSMTTTQSSGL